MAKFWIFWKVIEMLSWILRSPLKKFTQLWCLSLLGTPEMWEGSMEIHLQKNYSLFRHLQTQCFPPGAIPDLKEALICLSGTKIFCLIWEWVLEEDTRRAYVCVYVCVLCAFMYYFFIYEVNVVNVAYYCAWTRQCFSFLPRDFKWVVILCLKCDCRVTHIKSSLLFKRSKYE